MNNQMGRESAVDPQDAAESTDASAEQQNDSSEFQLSKEEVRVIGALMEKQLTTPDAYPLTVNSLITACNQKSNREPVTNYEQGEVVRTLRELESRSLVRYEMGARSERYEQRFTNQFSLSKKQQALIAIMFLRGPQTANELYTRTQRMYKYTDREDMMVSLERLTQGDQPLVVLIGKSAGQREDRYAHVLCGTPEKQQLKPVQGKADQGNPVRDTQSRAADSADSDLKAEVALLRAELDALYELTGYEKKRPDTGDS